MCRRTGLLGRAAHQGLDPQKGGSLNPNFSEWLMGFPKDLDEDTIDVWSAEEWPGVPRVASGVLIGRAFESVRQCCRATDPRNHWQGDLNAEAER